MTYIDAVRKADRAAKLTGRDYFVVVEAGEYDACDDLTLDTFYCGIGQDHILYCTGDTL